MKLTNMPKFRITHYKLYIMCFVMLGFIVSCSKKEEQKTQAPLLNDQNVVPIQLAKVEQVVRAEPVIASGLVASTDEARLSFKIGGIIQKILVREGQNVQKGQVLATLDLTEINAQVSQAQYGVEKSERDFKRVQNMYKDTAATLEQMQNVTTAFDVAKQNLQIAKFNRAYSQIVAPISGTIIKKLANEGELTGPGNPILFLSSSSANDWVIRVGVSDKDWARLKLGDKATVNLDAYPDETFTGTVSELTPIADPMNKLYEVEIKILPNGKKLASGLFGKIVLHPSQTRTYSIVPVESLFEGSGKNAFVFVLDQSRKKVKKIPVTTAYIETDKILITNGLENVSEVITSGGAFLTEKSTVVVK